MRNSSPIPKGAEPREQPCPECGATIPVHRGYSPWCDRCGWNLQPFEPPPPRNLFESTYVSAGRRLGRRLYQEMVGVESLQPRLTLSNILAFFLSALVYSLTIGFVILGVMLFTGLLEIWFVFAWIGGFICLGMAWLTRPHWPKLPENILSRDEFPALYHIADEITRALGAPELHGIVVYQGFGAAFTQAGWQRKRFVFLGLALFSILDGQEKVALVAHELAHSINGDIGRGAFVSTATRSLGMWYGLLRPRQIWNPRAGLVGLFAVPFTLVLLACAELFRLAAYALVHLLWHDTQRAEYLADLLAADIAGTEAKLALLAKLHLCNTFDLAAHRVSVDPDKDDVLVEFKQLLAELPPRELERIQRVERMEGSHLDATHPPTLYRLELLQSRPVSVPEVVLAPSELERLEGELAAVQERLRKD